MCNVPRKVWLPRFEHTVIQLRGFHSSMFTLPKSRARKHSRGQSVVEFALILPVLVLLLLITLDFGRLFMSYITLTNTTRVAANYGSHEPRRVHRDPDRHRHL